MDPKTSNFKKQVSGKEVNPELLNDLDLFLAGVEFVQFMDNLELDKYSSENEANGSKEEKERVVK